jgi:formate-dependent nitrite reductase cytochrome c552 subunit
MRFFDPKDVDDSLTKLVADLAKDNNPGGVFAEACSERMQRAWEKMHRIREAGGHPCFSRLVGKRCGDTVMKSKVGDNRPPCRPPCADHLSMWIRDGKPAVLVSQPYQAYGKDLSDLMSLCVRFDVRCVISSSSWYYPSGTLLIEMWAPGVKP